MKFHLRAGRRGKVYPTLIFPNEVSTKHLCMVYAASHLETFIIKALLTIPFKIVHSSYSKNSNSLPIKNYSVNEFPSYKSIFLGKATKPGINGLQSAASIQIYLLLIERFRCALITKTVCIKRQSEKGRSLDGHGTNP